MINCFAFFLVCLPVWLSSGLDSCVLNGLDFDLCASLICVILLDLILLADTNFECTKTVKILKSFVGNQECTENVNKKNKLEKISQDETSLAEGWYSLV